MLLKARARVGCYLMARETLVRQEPRPARCIEGERDNMDGESYKVYY